MIPSTPGGRFRGGQGERCCVSTGKWGWGMKWAQNYLRFVTKRFTKCM